jgi:hypothetical protein
LRPSTVLPVTNPPPAPRETVFSYLSRLAATWRTEPATLARHMGTQFRRFLELDPAAMDALVDWAELDPAQVEDLLSWTGVPTGNVRMTFRGEIFVSRALRNPVMRGCPVCLREDAAGHAGPPAAAMVMRGDWQMREAFVCVRHRHPLVELWRADRLADRHDMAARLREIEGDILSGALDRPAAPPPPTISGSARLQDGRLQDGRHQDGRDETWLEDQPCSPRRPSAGSWGAPFVPPMFVTWTARAAPITRPASRSPAAASPPSARPSTGSRRRPRDLSTRPTRSSARCMSP